MDNHDSHLSVEGLELAKSNGLTILTLPPHTSNKTQPLDRSVFGPFKSFYGNLCNSWMMTNPGKPLSIYQVAELSGTAWERAATPKNIKAGFRVSGIWPYDRDIFSEADFLPCTVTDRANPNEVVPQQTDGEFQTADRRLEPVDESLHPDTPTTQIPASSNTQVNTSNATKEDTVMISPQELRPFPKAPPRKETKRGRKRGKTMVATSTPELKRMREEKMYKENAATAKEQKKCNKNNTKAKRKLTMDEIEEREEREAEKEPVPLDDEDSFDEFDVGCEEIPEFKDPKDISIGDFVLVQFTVGTSSSAKCKYYVGCVAEMTNDLEVLIDFYRRKGNIFMKPQVEDKVLIMKMDIVAKLPMPTIQKGTARTLSRLNFGDLSFQMYNVM